MILSKEEFFKYSELAHNKNYTQQFGYFVGLLRRTRLSYLKNNKMFMSAVQMNMIKALSDLQVKATKTKREIKETKSEKDKSFVEKKLFIFREWIRIFQTIADGIAWRNLKFNRPLIRLMSENNSIGHISEEEVNIYASHLNKLPYFVIINDLTRCLRISDLTQILPNGKVFLYEIKRSGSLIKDTSYIFDEMKKHNRFFSRQELKQWVVQSAVTNNKIEVPVYKDGKIKNSLKAEIINCDNEIKNHFIKIKKLIKEANIRRYSQGEVEEGYFIKVLAIDKINELKEEEIDKNFKYQKDTFNKYAPDWIKKGENRIINITNYKCFKQEKGQYTRNVLPYSVLPFSSKDCVRLMMGQIYIEVNINLDILKIKFEQAGWKIEEPKIFAKKKYEAKDKLREIEDIEKYEEDDSLYHLSREFENGKYFSSLPFTLIMIMMSSFYGFDFLIDTADYMFKNSQRDMPDYRSVVINYLGERRILE